MRDQIDSMNQQAIRPRENCLKKLGEHVVAVVEGVEKLSIGCQLTALHIPTE